MLSHAAFLGGAHKAGELIEGAAKTAVGQYAAQTWHGQGEQQHHDEERDDDLDQGKSGTPSAHRANYSRGGYSQENSRQVALGG